MEQTSYFVTAFPAKELRITKENHNKVVKTTLSLGSRSAFLSICQYNSCLGEASVTDTAVATLAYGGDI